MLTYDELEEMLAAVEARSALRIMHRENRGQARPGSVIQALALSDDGLKLAPFTWGFTLPGNKKLVFNTRIESALEGSRLWAGPIREGRCVLPVATFFEPHGNETTVSPRTGKLMKRQYEFASPAGEPLMLASVQRGSQLSVVTCEPNASVAPVHPRMPLALRFEEVPLWFSDDFCALADRSSLELLARPEDDPVNPAQLPLF